MSVARRSFLSVPVQLRLLSQAEAMELERLIEGAPGGAVPISQLPAHLWAAAERLLLWQMPVSPTRH